MSIESKYKIIKSLGDQVKRKFGRTFLVEDKFTQKKFVLKAHRKNEKPHILERIIRESEFNFSDSGLPTVVDKFETENEYFLVLEYYEGVPLDEFWLLLKRKDRLSFIIDLIEKLVPIFEVLEHANVVHCDVKPSNLIVSGNKESFNVHLIDFGLAYRKGSQEKRNTLFPLGYAAPELLLNKLYLVDKRTDYYSIGIMIWRLYIGSLPLVHPNPSIFTNLQLTHPLPDNENLPKGLYPILAKMCSKFTFKLPPNTLPEEEVIESLKAGMNDRNNSLTEIIDDLKRIKEKPSFYQRISRR